MIRIHGKRVLAVLAFLMAIYVFFQLGLIRSTRSSFSDIVREQPDVENHVRQTPLRELIKVLCEQTRELTHDSLDYV